MPKEATNTKAPAAKKAAAAPYDKNKLKAKRLLRKRKKDNPNFEKRPRNFGIGNDIQPKRDLTHFVKWPKYVRLQRQKKILYSRLKVPPPINLFSKALDKNGATAVFRLLAKYRPEDRKAKKARLLAAAKAKVAAKAEKGAETKKEEPASKKPVTVKYGLKHVTALIEQKKAKLVILPHDVDPIELVVWIPALCRRMGIPFCIVKGKARLGQVVHKKKAAVLAITNVRAEDNQELGQIINSCKEKYLDKYDEHRKQWGGGKVGLKSTARRIKREQAIKKEEKARQQQQQQQIL